MSIRVQRPLFPALVFALAGALGMQANLAPTCWAQQAADTPESTTEAEPTKAQPTKSALIDTLNDVFRLLEKEDYLAASEYFSLPPDFPPELRPGMLSDIIRLNEISQSGIDVLNQDATFGPATETFGSQRAKVHAERAQVDVNQCYGFYHTTDRETGEVMAFWDGDGFKLTRLDDVGKLAPSDAADSVAMKSEAEVRKPKAIPHLELMGHQPIVQPVVDIAAIAQSLPQLESAANANPLDVAARANYAMALYQIGNYPLAWTQLRVAGKIDPNHSGAAQGMTVLFKKFESLSVFTVGMPPETVIGLLGDPDQVIELGESRQRRVYAFYGIDFQEGRLHEVIDLRGATEAMFQPKEIVTVDLDGRGWRCGSRNKANRQITALYYLPGEMISNWTEQVEVQRIMDAAGMGTMMEIAESMIAQVLAANPNMKYQILDTQDDSVIVALELPELPDFAKRHQLIRLFQGQQDVHRLAYTLKVDQPTQETQMKWLAIMKSANLESTQK
ncbi:tetratricopeptide repeat protein [Rubripirellula lacrimiformis]|nr:hypothetical protein [Rubripirellula lacrimiformis]